MPDGDASASIAVRLAPRCGVLKHRIARDGLASVPSGMALNQDTAPVLFDRALLRRRLDRARRVGPAAFLLDRVAEDMGDRLQAVTRDFFDAADIWTPGPALDEVLGSRCKSIRHLDLGHSETLPFEAQSLDLAVSALAFQFVNDLPGVLAQIRRALEAGRAIAGGDDRRRYADRAQAVLRRGGGRMRGRRVATRRAVCRSARHRRAAAARRLRAAGHRCGSARGALRQCVCADAGSAAHGRHQHPVRAAADADPPGHDAADGADLCRALRRRGRPHPRHLRCDLAVRLGAA